MNHKECTIGQLRSEINNLKELIDNGCEYGYDSYTLESIRKVVREQYKRVLQGQIEYLNGLKNPTSEQLEDRKRLKRERQILKSGFKNHLVR